MECFLSPHFCTVNLLILNTSVHVAGDKRSYLHLHTNCVVSLTCILGLACSSSGLRGMPTVWTGIQRVTTSASNQALR